MTIEDDLIAARIEHRQNSRIERAPYSVAAKRLLKMALREIDLAQQRDESARLDDLQVTVRQLFGVPAVSVVHTEPHAFEIIVNSDQPPWEALIALIAETEAHYSVGAGERRRECICVR